MSRQPHPNPHRPSRRAWRLRLSRAIERWLSWRSGSTSIQIRSHRGKRALRAGLSIFSVRAAAAKVPGAETRDEPQHGNDVSGGSRSRIVILGAPLRYLIEHQANDFR